MVVCVTGVVDTERQGEFLSQMQCIAPIQQRQASRPFSSPQRDDMI
jgi:hypothetical protein